jgi:hypothetical protein
MCLRRTLARNFLSHIALKDKCDLKCILIIVGRAVKWSGVVFPSSAFFANEVENGFARIGC